MNLVELNKKVSERAASIRYDDNCLRMPERYAKLLRLWPGEHYKWMSAYVELEQTRYILEMGRGYGLSLIALCVCLRPDGWIWSVDNVSIPSSTLIPDDIYRQPNVKLLVHDVIENSFWERVKPDILDFVLLDVDHSGHTERLVIDQLVSAGFKGLLLMDDIHVAHHRELLALYAGLEYPKLDITSSAHWAGSGLVWFGD